ncbi:PAS domain-containing protein [Bacillus mangrovi]|uniref:PAS domain-containing protein n=2 Tax=Metabacillus mangrovi TaxID=1491830 RepID=A0A7X2S4D5_9BACI|nr:PAS domain-containing protein [Metabacillus mangrovi]
MNSAQVGMSITDPSLPDNPLVYVNDGFYTLTGYSFEDAVGKNCRFLQGPGTNREAIIAVKEAIRLKESVTVELYNYKKNGTPFWNELHVEPVYIESENKTYFIGIQKDITEQRAYIDRITELSTPIVPIDDRISVLPLIGDLTPKRSADVMSAVSSYAADSEDAVIIVDLSGLIKMENNEAASLIQLHSILEMMGTELVLTGVSPMLILQTSSHLISDLSSIRTFMNVKQAIKALT